MMDFAAAIVRKELVSAFLGICLDRGLLLQGILSVNEIHWQNAIRSQDA